MAMATLTEQSWTACDVAQETPWPVKTVNTIMNMCAPSERPAVERFGRLYSTREPGRFMEDIEFGVDMRERTLRYPLQLAIISVSACLLKACYGASNSLIVALELAKSTMRSSVGELELGGLFHSHTGVNMQACDALQRPTEA